MAVQLIAEFKQFALKGNAIDMAVGVVVGTAFNKIVDSMVNDLIMPPLGIAIGGVDFKDLLWVLKPAVTAGGKVVSPEVAIRYGQFFNALIQFFVIAWSVFLAVKAMTKLSASRSTPNPANPPAEGGSGSAAA
ncbi:large-conductance mechanosensitive channel protein MscL [Methylacidimicrobium tartarophylax]|uniref:Large-conductance mechanosensitive channel n=1 Tax=Methylacidimicrobium tartarophylax TaxID=1041768 RepID=A0A5E6MHF8_9BACT|nr:large-conductance mechanosensitive channel protein MscL [Methylacidimicrobium tartarophylax]VVM07743.1 Large-conductance mechanosensitive channel [Methylacidimicrobium tartarophylax]